MGDAPDAFALAFDQSADHASPNFLWFRARHPRFVYLDRIAVVARGLGQALYTDLIAASRQAGHVLIGCEVNRAPPNPGSMAFHAALGFAEAGRAKLDGREKVVAYLELRL